MIPTEYKWRGSFELLQVLSPCKFRTPAGLYPPQNQSEVMGDLESLLNTFQLVLDEMPLGEGSEADRNAMHDKVTSSFDSLREAALQLPLM